MCTCNSNYEGTDCSHKKCNVGDIFGIECLDDFKVKINVLDSKCFAQEYPTLTFANLVVHAKEENDVAPSNTCKAYGGTGTCSNCIFGDAELKAAVTPLSTALYFDGKVCSANPKYSTTDNVLLYTAKLTTYIHDSSVNMLFNPAMLPVNFQCKYKQSVNGHQSQWVR